MLVTTTVIEQARAVAETVTDPELPMLTLADLGVLRDVDVVDGCVIVSITPTYTGCPAMDAMRDDLARTLHDAGYDDVEVRTVLRPAWSTDWISDEGRRKLADAGIAPPGAAPRWPGGPVPLTLQTAEQHSGAPDAGITLEASGGVANAGGLAGRRAVRCPQCGSADTEETSRFGATACKALWRCRACREPFEHVKEI